MFAAQSHCPGVPDQLMVNYYIQHTPSSPLSLPHRGSYGLSYDDSVTWPVVVRGISYNVVFHIGFFCLISDPNGPREYTVHSHCMEMVRGLASGPGGMYGEC